MATDDPDVPDEPRAEEPRAAEPRAAEPRADEPRVKDLLARPHEVEDKLDRATLDELASWFERPSIETLEEQAEIAAAAAADPLAEHPDVAVRRLRREAAAGAADPALVARISRLPEVDIRLHRNYEPAQFIDETILNAVVKAELDRQFAEYPAPDILEFDQPEEIGDIVRSHNAPQAILRDLYRPVESYELRFESPFAELPDMDPMREVREAIRTRIELEFPESPFQQGRAARAVGTTILREPWSDHWAAVEEIKKARGY